MNDVLQTLQNTAAPGEIFQFIVVVLCLVLTLMALGDTIADLGWLKSFGIDGQCGALTRCHLIDEAIRVFLFLVLSVIAFTTLWMPARPPVAAFGWDIGLINQLLREFALPVACFAMLGHSIHQRIRRRQMMRKDYPEWHWR